MHRDIWVVTFDNDEELFLLKKQIESLILHGNTLTYNIIINSSDDIAVRLKMKRSGILKLLTMSNFDYNIFKRSQFLAEDEWMTSQKRDNYISQQLLKLQIYRRSLAKEHLILDSKTILLNSKALEIKEPNGDISSPINFFGCYEYFTKIWHNSNSIPVKGTATPFLFKNNILESLEMHFNSRENYIKELTQPFYVNRLKRLAEKKDKTVLTNPDCLSEFLIYNLYEQKVNKNYTPLAKKREIKRMCQTSIQLFSKDFLAENDILLFHRKFVKEMGITNAEKIIDHYQKEKGKHVCG